MYLAFFELVASFFRFHSSLAQAFANAIEMPWK